VARKAIGQFIREFGDFGAETLAFFYRYVVVSEEIVEYIFPGDAVKCDTENAQFATNTSPLNPPQGDFETVIFSKLPAYGWSAF
jgi:hypothetical protein